MAKMFRELRADEVECRVSTINENGCSLLLYKDARCDMNILDETVGTQRWQRKHELIDGKLFCSVGIFYPELEQWIWKQDVGTESFTEKEKGQASDAFKRACFCHGIGRELYTAPFIWIAPSDVSLKDKNGKKITYDRFRVKDIDYTDGVITKLRIENVTLHKIVFAMGDFDNTAAPNNKTDGKKTLSLAKINTMRKKLADSGVDESFVCEMFKTESLETFTEAQFKNLMDSYDKVVDKWSSKDN